VPYEPSAELVERLEAELAELPGSRIERLTSELGYELALDLVTSGRDALYSRLVAAGAEPKAAANVLMNQLAAAGVDPDAVNPNELAKLIEARSSIPTAVFNEGVGASGSSSFAAIDFISQSASPTRASWSR